MKNKTKVFLIVITILTILTSLLIQFIQIRNKETSIAVEKLQGFFETYKAPEMSLLINTSKKLNKSQTILLAKEILKNTPEYTYVVGWDKDRNETKQATFSWVSLSPITNKNPYYLLNEVLKQLKDKYKTVYYYKEIPENLIHRNKDGTWVAYENGFSFSFVVSYDENNNIIICYEDYVGNLAASKFCKKYKWDGTKWIDLGFYGPRWIS